MATLKTTFSDGDILYSGVTTDTDKLNGITTQINTNTKDVGLLGEVRMFALSMTGAVTKASLQTNGWAICDGTTPASQGISSPTITTTPNLENKFIRGSDDETSGNTGGSETHNHKWVDYSGGGGANTVQVATSSTIDRMDSSFDSSGNATNLIASGNDLIGSNDYYTNNESTLPSYYELVYFIKVKV